MLLAEGVIEEVSEKYIQYEPEVVFSKTKNRSTVGKLNLLGSFFARNFLNLDLAVLSY